MLHSVMILQIRLQRAEVKALPANGHFLQQIQEKKTPAGAAKFTFMQNTNSSTTLTKLTEVPGITDINNPYKSFYFVIYSFPTMKCVEILFTLIAFMKWQPLKN